MKIQRPSHFALCHYFSECRKVVLFVLLPREDGTFDAGQADVLCVLKDVGTGRYHAAFFEECPLLGSLKPISELDFIRLKSKMHHTEGADSLSGALVHLQELSEKIRVGEKCLWEQPLDWNGETGIVLTVPNWLK